MLMVMAEVAVKVVVVVKAVGVTIRFKPDVLRPGVVGMRGSIGIPLRPCMIWSTLPASTTSSPSLHEHNRFFTYRRARPFYAQRFPHFFFVSGVL